MTTTAPDIETPARKSRRRPALWAAAGITVAAIIGGGVALANHSGDDTSPRQPASSEEFDHLIAWHDAEQAQREAATMPLPRIGTERVTIAANTPIPALVVMTGDDLCHLAGGEVVTSKPAQCSVDIPDTLGVTP